jgi:hypothetical protein
LVSARISAESLSIFYQGAKEQALKTPAPVLVLGTGSFVVAGVLPEITHGFISALGAAGQMTAVDITLRMHWRFCVS